MKDEFFDSFAAALFAETRMINFICITDGKGRQLGLSFRKDMVKKSVGEKQIEKFTHQMVVKALLAQSLGEFTGKLRYHIGVYEKSFSATIPVTFNPTHQIIVIVLLDIAVQDPRHIIEEVILPLIAEKKDFFL